jgi:hypothetical protein
MGRRVVSVLGCVAVLVVAVMSVPKPALALPAPPPCFIGGPGYTCAGTVSFSPYTLSTVFRPFQGASGTGQQPDITVSFHQLVHAVRAFVNDPDNSGTTTEVHLYQCCWISYQTITGDGDPSVFSVGGGGEICCNSNGNGFDAVRLHSATGDYVNFRVEYQTVANSTGPWCKVNAASYTCPYDNTTATVSPFAQGSVFDPFQGVTGTGQQPPIDIYFEAPVATVAATALDPDLAGNRMEAFAANGTLLGTANFDFDNRAGWTNWSTKSLSVANITHIRLTSATGDYTVFQGLTVWPMGPPPLHLSINGPSSISVKGTYTFSSTYQGFNPNPTFAWSERFCGDAGCSSWVYFSSAASFNRVLSPDCSGSGNNTYELQLLMTNSDGRTATANHTTYLCNLP